jgi:hypothetical protein
MIRWIMVLVFAISLAAQGWGQFLAGQGLPGQNTPGQAAPAEVSKGQTPAAPTVAAKPDAPPPANPDDPLEQFRNFSALMVGTVLPHDEREGHIYRSGNQLRMEGMENRGYFITDLTTFDTYGLSIMGCASMKEPYLRSFPFMLSGHNHKVVRVPAGKDTVDGHPCQVEEATYTGGLAQPWRLRLWEAQDLHGFPVRIEVQHGPNNGVPAVIQYKDVVLGPQDPTLFIFPKDCAELPEPGEKEPAESPKPPLAPPAH